MIYIYMYIYIIHYIYIHIYIYLYVYVYVYYGSVEFPAVPGLVFCEVKADAFKFGDYVDDELKHLWTEAAAKDGDTIYI